MVNTRRQAQAEDQQEQKDMNSALELSKAPPNSDGGMAHKLKVSKAKKQPASRARQIHAPILNATTTVHVNTTMVALPLTTLTPPSTPPAPTFTFQNSIIAKAFAKTQPVDKSVSKTPEILKPIAVKAITKPGRSVIRKKVVKAEPKLSGKGVLVLKGVKFYNMKLGELAKMGLRTPSVTKGFWPHKKYKFKLGHNRWAHLNLPKPTEAKVREIHKKIVDMHADFEMGSFVATAGYAEDNSRVTVDTIFQVMLGQSTANELAIDAHSASAISTIDVAHQIYDNLNREAGNTVDTLIDEREDVDLGWKLKDADLIGYPVVLIIGKSWEKSKHVEVQCRRLGIRKEVELDNIAREVHQVLDKL
ncbi:hypothetical protein LTR66_017407 [Elasticomyces elasticus]|nr:hypothetical protein LTR66_017407 [Elasticomyces elasticus]